MFLYISVSILLQNFVFTAFCGVGGCVAWGSEGARGGGKNERLRPDSTGGLGSEGVCGLGARRSRGKRAGCALEAGFCPGGGVEAGLKPRVSKTL